MIFLTGDTHGLMNIDKFFYLDKEKISKDDYIIILGDSGFLWYNDKRDNEVFSWYKKNIPCQILFIDGNHDNHVALSQLPIMEQFGGNTHKINNQITHLMRGEIYNIEGKSFFTMGGGNSVDRYRRTEGIDWWKEEMPSKEEYDNAKSNLQKCNHKVDYILSHDAPSMFLDEIIPLWAKIRFGNVEYNELNYFFDEIYKNVDFKRWFFGHHHVDFSVNKNLRCLFNEIIEIK